MTTHSGDGGHETLIDGEAVLGTIAAETIDATLENFFVAFTTKAGSGEVFGHFCALVAFAAFVRAFIAFVNGHNNLFSDGV